MDQHPTLRLSRHRGPEQDFDSRNQGKMDCMQEECKSAIPRNRRSDRRKRHDLKNTPTRQDAD
jgi:hypothetical protein